MAERIDVQDDTGRPVSLPAPAGRIISLSPHLTEILFDLEVGDRIVATVRYSDYPEAAKEIPRLGDAFSVNVEAVLANTPDIIFAWRTGGSGKALEQLIELGIPVYFNEAPGLSSIGNSVINIGKLVGEPERGAAIADTFNEALETFRRSAPQERVRTFFQISDQSLYTVNGDHLIGEAISICGGENIFADVVAPVPQVGKEAVLSAAPDLIIITQVPGSPPSDWVSIWQAYEGFEGRVKTIDPNLISRPGPRMMEGIGRMCDLIRNT
jgi:iron complex transport system substrate-binding protein